MKWIVLFVIAAVGCTSKNPIATADRLEVIYYNNGDTLRTSSSNDTLIKFFNEVLSKKTLLLPDCKAMGRVDFYTGNNLVQTVGLTSGVIAGDRSNCSHLFIDKKAWKMTYNIGRYLDETFYNLKKKDE